MKRNIFGRALDISSEILSAIKNGDPVVSLESAIITHGMPYPTNFNTARNVESVIRSYKAIPATIAVIEGRIRIGTTEEELLALSKKSALKVSRRDLPFVLGNSRVNGGTTVSGTSIISNMVGIKTFVTGGVGGVHRDGELTMDVSADLVDLSQCPITVVSAGIKSILDIKRTLEVLETNGVCVLTFSKNEKASFPAFFIRESGLNAPYNVGDCKKIAEMMIARDALKLKSAMLVGVPIPGDFESLESESAIQKAINEAKEKNISGKEITPFVLAKVTELTDGCSLKANIGLINNNASIGAKISVQYASLISQNFIPPLRESKRNEIPVVIGGSVVDFIAKVNHHKLLLNGSTHKGSIRSTFGGVGRNIVQAMSQLNMHPHFISAVGCDNFGKSIFRGLNDTSGIFCIKEKLTANYCAITDEEGEVLCGIGDMDIHEEITPKRIKETLPLFSPSLVVIDGNIPEESMNVVKNTCLDMKTNPPLLFEPTDVLKANKPFVNRMNASAITYASPNYKELKCILKPFDASVPIARENLQTMLHNCIDLSHEILLYIQVLIITLGENGVFIVRRGKSNERLPTTNCGLIQLPGNFIISAVHYPSALKPERIISVSGAGDSFIAGFMAAVMKGISQDIAVGVGMQLATKSLENIHPVPDLFFNINWNYNAPGKIYL